MDKIIARKRWFFLFSLLITIPGLLFTLATPISGGTIGLKFSIDYTGGTIWEFRPESPADPLVVQAAVASAGHEEATVTEAGTGFLIVRTKPLDLQVGQDKIDNAGAELQAIREAVVAAIGPIAEEGSVSTVGPVISQDLTQQALLLVVLGSIGIVLWMTYRFRNLRFGMAALVALLHDVIVTVGVFSIFQLKFDLTIVAALLTILGYSVNDTVVIFDRLRENLAKYKAMPLREMMNLTANETLSRTIMTATTTILSLTCLIVLGGDVIRGFVFAMLFGVIIGTYSTLYVAKNIVLMLGLDRSDKPKTGKPADHEFADVDA